MKYLLSSIALAVICLHSCSVENPVPENAEELITTLQMTCLDNSDGTLSTLTFLDVDGDGGDSPVLSVSKLRAHTEYSVSLSLSNEATTPPLDITAEIQEESDVHQFFYLPEGVDLEVTYADEDAMGLPIGLQTILRTGEPGSGTLTLILRHEPDKTAQGVSDGNPDMAGGDSDIEVVFPIVIE